MRDLYILLDDQAEVTILYPRTITFDVAPGEHRIKITNRLFSHIETFSLAEGERVSFEVANVSAGCLFAPLIVLGGTGAYKVQMTRG